MTALYSLLCGLVFDPLVKVDVQLCRLVLAAHHEWLLQFVEVLSVQLLTPLTEVLPHHLIQNLDCLSVCGKCLLANVRIRHEVGLLKRLEGKA